MFVVLSKLNADNRDRSHDGELVIFTAVPSPRV